MPNNDDMTAPIKKCPPSDATVRALKRVEAGTKGETPQAEFMGTR